MKRAQWAPRLGFVDGESNNKNEFHNKINLIMYTKKYEIASDTRIRCRISSIEKKEWGWIIKIINAQNGQYIAHKIEKHMYPDQNAAYKEAIAGKVIYPIHRNVIKSSVGVYKRLTWVDVDNGKCEPCEVGMIERDGDGMPVIYNEVVLYDRFYDMPDNRLSAENFFLNNYVEVTSPSASDALNYTGRRTVYHSGSYHSASYDNYDYDPDVFNEIDRNRTEEDCIMDALENGYGEYYGN